MAGADFGISFAAAIARDSVAAAIREARYCFQFNNFVEELVKEGENLMRKRNSVLKRVSKSKDGTREIDSDVMTWLKEADIHLAEVKKLQEKVIASKSYCFGCFPNWICLSCLAKQLQKKTKALFDHKDRKFEQFDRLLTLPGMEYYPTKGFLYFESTKVAYDQILEALKDDTVRMMGLCGMGGSGKTTLVKVVGKNVKNLFQKVFFLRVSATVEVRKIQGKIAGSLGLELREEDESERAQRLWLRLSSCEERILIILDDVWEELDFEAIGIPFGVNHKVFKIILTTRRIRVCDLMRCERKFNLSLLTEEEAWSLFQNHAGKIDDMLDVARKVANECKQLPVAIEAVASTLKGKDVGLWEEALEMSEDSRPMNIEGQKNPYTCLQSSYDNLKSKEARSLILLCCLFPKDYTIPVELLTRIEIGLGLHQEIYEYRRARKKVSAAIEELKDSHLLLEADEKQCVKMHALVRVVGLWIEEKEIQVVIWRQNYRKAKDATIKYSTIRYLWCEVNGTFPNKLDFPKLEFLYVRTDLKSVKLPDDIFEAMKELKVLVLANQSDGRQKPMLWLPKSIQFLTKLHCLLLFGWELSDISILGSLKELETLALQSCSFHELPNGIAGLPNLKLLDLSECQILRNPFKVIGRCSQLKELYFIKNKGTEWMGQEEENAAEFLDKNRIDLQGLERYRLEIGKSFGVLDPADFSISRCLSIQCFDASTTSATIKGLMQKAEVLCLGEIHRGCKNIIPDIVQTIGGGMNELIELLICDSDKIEFLIDNANHRTVFLKLAKLRISAMECLEALCNGPPPTGLFEKLEELRIKECSQLHSALSVDKLNLCGLKFLEFTKCPMLTCLFTPVVAQSLALLEILEIRECSGLKRIIESEAGEIIPDYTDQNNHTILFPKLKELLVERCEQLESFIPVSYAHGLVHLESMQIIDDPGLKYVFGQYNHENQLPYQNENKFPIKFPVLKSICLEDLPNLVGICPENYCLMWPSLHELSFLDCPELKIMSINNSIVGPEVRHHGHATTEEVGPLATYSLQTVQNVKTLYVRTCNIQGIFQLAGHPIDEELDPLTLYLQELCLENLPELGYISDGPTQFMRLQNLENLEIYRCRKLKFIFSACIAEGLPQLKVLKITHCDQLEQLIADKEHPSRLNHCKESFVVDGYLKTISSSREDFLRARQSSGSFNLCSLERLVLESCPMLISLFAQSSAKTMTSLEDLRVESCHGLKYIIKDERLKENEGEGTIQDDDDFIVSMFPRLKNLEVEKCNLLEYLFPVSFAQGLVELRNIEICETPQLEYVFGQSCDEDHSSYQYQNKIQIKFPKLEDIKLRCLPNLISLCSKSYHATCSPLLQLSLKHIGLSIPSINNLMVGSEVMNWYFNSAKDIQAIVEHAISFKSLIVEDSKMEGIFNFEGLPIDGRVTSGLVEVDLHCLTELRYICVGPKSFISLENLRSLTITECRKLKFVFSASILRILPQLETLMIVNCEELEQIVEEDEENQNQSNPHARSVCFPQLTVILVIHCNKLTRLFSISTSLELPKLERLIIKEASQLEELFGCEKVETEDRVEIMLPKLEHLILVELPSLVNVCRGSELQTVKYRVVLSCPKLSLTSTTTIGNLLKQYQNKDNEMDDHARGNLVILLQMVVANGFSRIREASNENSTLETTHIQMDQNDQYLQVQAALVSEPSQSIKETEKQIIQKNLAMATSSTDSEDMVDQHSVNELVLIGEESGSETDLRARQGLGEMISDSHYDDSQNLKELADFCTLMA